MKIQEYVYFRLKKKEAFIVTEFTYLELKSKSMLIYLQLTDGNKLLCKFHPGLGYPKIFFLLCIALGVFHFVYIQKDCLHHCTFKKQIFIILGIFLFNLTLKM